MAVEFIEENCIGCKLCLKSCPYNAIDMVDVPGKDKPVARKHDGCIECGACVEACKFEAIVKVGEDEEPAPATDLTSYSGVWVFAEQRNGIVARAATQLLGKGRELADARGTDLSAILLGDDIRDLPAVLFAHGAGDGAGDPRESVAGGGGAGPDPPVSSWSRWSDPDIAAALRCGSRPG